MTKIPFILALLILSLASKTPCFAGDGVNSADHQLVVASPLPESASRGVEMTASRPVDCEEALVFGHDKFMGAVGRFLRLSEKQTIAIGIKGGGRATGRYQGLTAVFDEDGAWRGQYGIVFEGAVTPASLPGASPARLSMIGLRTEVPFNEIDWIKEPQYSMELFSELWMPEGRGTGFEKQQIEIHNELMRALNLQRALHHVNKELYRVTSTPALSYLIGLLNRGQIFNVHGSWDRYAQQAISNNPVRRFAWQWSHYKSLFAPSPKDLESLLLTFCKKLDELMASSQSSRHDYLIAFWAQQMVLELQPAHGENLALSQALMNYIMVRSAAFRGTKGVLLDFNFPAVSQAIAQVRESGKVFPVRPFQQDLQNYLVPRRVAAGGTFSAFSERRLNTFIENGLSVGSSTDPRDFTNPTYKFLYAFDSTRLENRSTNPFAISFDVGAYLRDGAGDHRQLLEHPGWETMSDYYRLQLTSASLTTISENAYVLAASQWLEGNLLRLLAVDGAMFTDRRLP